MVFDKKNTTKRHLLLIHKILLILILLLHPNNIRVLKYKRIAIHVVEKMRRTNLNPSKYCRKTDYQKPFSNLTYEAVYTVDI